MAIHPNPDGPLQADSPYKRKLVRIREDMNIVLGIAPSNQKEDVYAVLLQLDMLIAGL